jgi:hypothetical protein
LLVAPAEEVTLTVTHLHDSTVVVFGTLVRDVYDVVSAIAEENSATAFVFNQSAAVQLDL